MDRLDVGCNEILQIVLAFRTFVFNFSGKKNSWKVTREYILWGKSKNSHNVRTTARILDVFSFKFEIKPNNHSFEPGRMAKKFSSKHLLSSEIQNSSLKSTKQSVSNQIQYSVLSTHELEATRVGIVLNASHQGASDEDISSMGSLTFKNTDFAVGGPFVLEAMIIKLIEAFSRNCGWLYGCVIVLLCGCIDAWVCGCMDVWLCGCVVAWVCGWMVVCL